MESAALESLVARFLAGRGAEEAELSPERLKIVGQLDALYWTEVEKRAEIAAREHPDQLSFGRQGRLLIDLGLLDWRLLREGEKARPALLREIYAPSPPGLLYFSEWLSRRYGQFLLYGRVGSTPAAASTRKREQQALHETRERLFTQLAPLFRNLPGFLSQSVELFLTGRLDATIEELSRQFEEKEDERLAEQRKQLVEIRARMIARARERARSMDDLALFDAFAKFDAKRGSLGVGAAKGASKDLPAEERIGFVKSELKLVRSLLRLGVTGSGLAKTFSVLATDGPRLTKADAGPVIAAVRECDPGMPGTPDILLAPYVGTGFYEWDRDTVFVPIHPTRSGDEAIVTALANFRLAVDALQQHGRLKRSYESAFGGAEFHGSFIRDYKNWALGVGRGFKGALDPDRYAFFREHIGPSPEWLFATRDLVALTPDERAQTVRSCRARLNRAEGGFEERLRLAIAYFRESRETEAMEQLSEAARLRPIDGRTLFSVGWLAAKMSLKDRAREAFTDAIEICPTSIWSVYATDELQKL